MVTENPFSDVIRALARADWDTADSYCEEMRDSGRFGSPLIIGAAFALAVNRHFDPDATPTDVATWVSTARAQHPDADTPPTLEMEGLIRAALGEPELVDNIPAETALEAEIFILMQLLLEANLSAAEADEFVAEAEELAAEYSPPPRTQSRSTASREATPTSPPIDSLQHVGRQEGR